jgi:hypothetical protein
MDGVDPLWCWAHIRRYFIRAGDAHEQLRFWRDQWVAQIADLYLAHKAMAAAGPATGEYAAARAGFEEALGVIDEARRFQATGRGLYPAAKKVLATLDREWEAWPATATFLTWTWTITSPSAPCAPRSPAQELLRQPRRMVREPCRQGLDHHSHRRAPPPRATGIPDQLPERLRRRRRQGPEGPALDQFLPWIPGPVGSRDCDPPGISQSG